MKDFLRLIFYERSNTITKIIWEIISIILVIVISSPQDFFHIQYLILIFSWVFSNLILGSYQEDYSKLTSFSLLKFSLEAYILGVVTILFFPDYFDSKLSYSLVGIVSVNRTFLMITKRWINKKNNNQKAIILGLPNEGVLSIINNVSGYDIVGFITDIPYFKSKKLFGLPIYYFDDYTIKKLHKNNVRTVYQVDKNLQTIKRNSLLKKKFIEQGYRVFEIDEKETLKGNIDLKQIFSNYQELILGRPEIKIDANKLKEYYTNKTIIIFGGCGSIGSEIVDQIINLSSYKELVIVDNNEEKLFYSQTKHHNQLKVSHELIDIKNYDLINNLLCRKTPDIVFNAAAYKHVPIVEDNKFTGLQNNVLGCVNIIKSCIEFDVGSHILISSDKAVNPTNVMGASKRICELISSLYSNKTNKTKFIITRFGNVLGSSGSVIPIFLNQIRNSIPITITDFRMKRFFMSIAEAASLVIESSRIGRDNELLIFDMQDQIKILDLAERLIDICGYNSNTYPIIETGLRNGEKLYEEIFQENENQKRHEKSDLIFIGNIENLTLKREKNINEFLEILYENKIDSLRSFDLKKIVTTYQQNEKNT